jgi:hypothetical protein
MMKTLTMSYDSRIEGYKKDIERLERDMGKLDTELIVLRAKKDKTIIEQASEFAQIKEAITTISGGGGDDEDTRSIWEKVANQVIENPEAVGHMVGMATGQGTPVAQPNPPQQQLTAPQQQQAAPLGVDDVPMGQPFRAEDGEVYVKVPPDGSVVTYEQAVAMAEAQQDQQDQAAGKPDPSEVKMAITFMESAFTAGTTSSDFASSAKSMIPQNILKYIESVGVDTFLNEVAVLESGSPLRNQAGRTYMREVAKFLLEGIPG